MYFRVLESTVIPSTLAGMIYASIRCPTLTVRSNKSTLYRIITLVIGLLAAAMVNLQAQTCSNVAVGVSSDSQFLIGSSTGGSTYSFTANGQTIASGTSSQLGLYHFDGSLTNTTGVAPKKPTGDAFVAGKFGQALQLASGGMVEYAAKNNLSFSNGTIEMWIALEQAPTAAVYSAYDNSLLRYVAPNGDQLMLSEASTGVFYGGTVVGGNYMGAGGGTFSGWSVGQWHHIALTYSKTAGRFRLYIDGSLITEADYTVAMPETGGSFTVAGDPFGEVGGFLIDEMRISNTEATPQQIQSDARQTTAFANDEVYLPMSGLSAADVTFQADGSSGSSCGTATYDYTPLTNVQPASGLLPTGSTVVNLSFNTAQAAMCRYSTGTAAAWSSMQAFDSTAVTAHSGTIWGISSDPRVLNTVYIACSNNTSYVTTLEYRVVAGATGAYPRVGSIWTGEYVYANAPAQAEQMQLFLGATFSPGEATALRAANPSVLILPSINAMETTNGTPVVPSSYYLRDTSGNMIQDWPGNYVLDLTNPAVPPFLAAYAAQVLSQANYAFDGIFFDNFRTQISNLTDMYGNPVAIDTNGDGVADNPATLDAAWSAGVYQELADFRQLMPNAYVSGHLGENPPAPSSLSTFNGDSLVFTAANVREGSAAFGTLFNTYQTWFAGGQSPVITMVQSSPPNQIAYGYGYTPLSAMLPSTVDFAQTYYPNMRFGLATALMNNGFSTYDFGDTGADVAWWYDEYNFNLGTPLGPATQIGATTAANMLTNPAFENGLTDWSLQLNTPAVATVAADTSIVAQGTASAHVDITTAGTAGWEVSFEQDNIPLTSGMSYQLQFWARSDAPRNITLNAQGGAPNYAQYGLQQSVAIDSNWTFYTLSFVSTATASDGRIQFFVGDIAGNVWIDGVTLTATPTSVYRRDYTNGVVLLNGSSTPQTVELGAGFQRFSGTQAPMYQYIVDDASAGFSATGSWSTVTYDTGYSSTGGGEVANGPYYHAWNRTLHQLSSGSGTAQWNLNIPADGTYTIQAWLPAAPTAGSWTTDAVYQIVSGGAVIDTVSINQTAAGSGDQWHTIATLSLTAAGNPQLRLTNGASGALIADAIYVTSAALYNNGQAASSVTLAGMDGILLQRETPAAATQGGIGGVVNAASMQPGISPSSMVAVNGFGFGSKVVNYSTANLAGGLLPTSLGGVSATIDGLPAAVYSLTPTQAVLIAPNDANAGSVSVELTVNGTVYASTATLQKYAPAFFPYVSGGIAYGHATHANGTVVSASAPAIPGETITMLATGLGPTNPATPPSQAVVNEPVAAPVTVTMGGVAAQVKSATQVGPGSYQIAVTVPSVGAGNQAVQLGVSGFLSPAGVFLPIE